MPVHCCVSPGERSAQDLAADLASWPGQEGVKVGLQGEVIDGLTLAGSYQSKIWMSKFDDYEDLFAEGGDLVLHGQHQPVQRRLRGAVAVPAAEAVVAAYTVADEPADQPPLILERLP